MRPLEMFALVSLLASFAVACSETCTKDSQCSSGPVCCNGACVATGERCEPCNNDRHCPTGQQCVARRCVFAGTGDDGGSSRSDGGARDGGSTQRDGSTSTRDGAVADTGTRDAGNPRVGRRLSKVLADETWPFGQSATGMTVDAQGRIYLVESERILRVDGTTVSEYMTVEDAEMIVAKSRLVRT